MTKKQQKFYREEIAAIPRFEMSPEELDEIMDVVHTAWEQGKYTAELAELKARLKKKGTNV